MLMPLSFLHGCLSRLVFILTFCSYPFRLWFSASPKEPSYCSWSHSNRILLAFLSFSKNRRRYQPTNGTDFPANSLHSFGYCWLERGLAAKFCNATNDAWRFPYCGICPSEKLNHRRDHLIPTDPAPPHQTTKVTLIYL